MRVLLFMFMGIALGTHSLNLTSANFDEAFTTHKNLLVMFHSPSCSHCVKLNPIFEEAAELLSANDNVKLARVDVSEDPDLMKRFDILGYPRIKFFNP